MAYDKVVDSAVLDAGLKQIADAIRAKGGTSDNLAFPQAMADAISAIESVEGGDDGSFKGVIERTAANPVLPSGLTKIGEYAFYEYSNLEQPVIPDSVTSIEERAFYGCTNLALTSLPDSLTSIGDYAFYGCYGLTEITFKIKPSTLRSSAFQNCSNLKTINVPWAEGEVANAPWGATNATINYNYSPQPEEPEEPEDPADKYTWDAVFASIDAGTYATDYTIGDMIPLDLGSEGLINMQIVAFDADDLADGSGKAPITWISKELLKTTHRMNPALVTNDDGTYQEGTGTFGGWEKCELRAYLKDSIKPMIPENVRNFIKEVNKTHESVNATLRPINQTTGDDVWVPSKNEVKNSGTYSQIFTDSNSRIKNIIGKPVDYESYYNNSKWATRDTMSSNSGKYWQTVGNYGNVGTHEYVDYTTGICLCFCT